MVVFSIAVFSLLLISTFANQQSADQICSNVKSINRLCGISHNGSSAVMDHDEIDKILQSKVDEAIGDLRNRLDECKALNNQQNEELSRIKKELAVIYGTDCRTVKSEDYVSGKTNAGIYQIYVARAKLKVYCDLITDGGGWIVIQRRMDGSEDFFREYEDYVKGFGDNSGEFWIGLDNIYNIVFGKNFELRIDMEDWSGVKKYAKYSVFRIGQPSEDYALEASGYSGNAGDSLSRHSGFGFSTKDHDVDAFSASCAKAYKGGWWYEKCHSSNLNGFYHKGGPHKSYADGVNWHAWKGYNYSLKFVEMKIRPVQA